MRYAFTLLVMLTVFGLFSGCTGGSVQSPPGSSNNANAANSAGMNNNTGSREGIGPRDTGIGGTSEGNANSAVKGNSNIEPTGVNRNAGQGTNSNKP
jgi:hypothetical protein